MVDEAFAWIVNHLTLSVKWRFSNLEPISFASTMKHFVTLFFFFTSAVATMAQPVVYQGFEVDSAAEPRGGMPFLGTFLQANLRKPVAVEAKGAGGRVILSAVIEPNGQPTDIKVVQAGAPDLGPEAVRVFSQFRAWKPAYKDGNPVRQAVTIPVMFPANKPFRYENGAKITYYDAKQQLLPDSSEQARYKQVLPVNAVHMPIGDLIIYERKRANWKELLRLPLVRIKDWHVGLKGQPLYLVGHQNKDQLWLGTVFSVDDAGTVFGQAGYEWGRRVGSEIRYHANGLVAEKIDDDTDRNARFSWYPNGQIKQIWTADKLKTMQISEPELIMGVWDSTGRQLVKEGNGLFISTEARRSKHDTAQHTLYTEQGQFVAGLREGVWTGRYADGSYFYEERYEKGTCLAGKAISAGSDTTRYTVREQQPEFPGGMQGLGQFLAQNLRYPADAQRAGVQGRVNVSFVVCTDGTLCDYEIVKGVDPTVDEEALRVVKAMNGRWKPGVQRGVPVRVKYHMPINFTLN